VRWANFPRTWQKCIFIDPVGLGDVKFFPVTVEKLENVRIIRYFPIQWLDELGRKNEVTVLKEGDMRVVSRGNIPFRAPEFHQVDLVEIQPIAHRMYPSTE
jgi:hypothetical protein